MTIEERTVGSVVVLDLGGRLVLDDGDALLKEKVNSLLTSGNQHVVLNVADVSYVDSAGLGALVASFLAARTHGGVLRLINPSKRLQELLAMSRLLPLVRICESEAEAIASFAAAL
jgi:anti-sigma B factor antagonist